jgi:hypothetical protein
MFDEMFMEDCIEEAPSVFLGCELEVSERQQRLGGFRPDIVGTYQGETWIVEIQQRALDRVHLYKCLEYRDLLKERDKIESVKLVVVCNTIEEKYLPSAKTHGVEVVAIDREKFVELAAQFCPKSIAKFFKRRELPEIVTTPRSMAKHTFRPLGWTGHHTVFDILEHIHSECGRTGTDLGTLRVEKYWSILHQVNDLIGRDWRHSLSEIVSPENWNVDKLVSQPKEWQPDFLKGITRIRKPVIEVQAFVTIKDNLSIIWWPKTPNYDHHSMYNVGDWARWPGESTYGWTRPSNELVFIRDIDRLHPGRISHRFESDTCNWDVLDELFIALIKASYDWLCNSLSAVVDVEKITDFEFELIDPSPTDFESSRANDIWKPKRIVGWSIYNIETRRREQERRWIENFENEYKVSLKRVVDAYNTCLSRGRNRVASNRTRYIATEFEKDGIALSKAQLDQIIARLRTHHSHYIEVTKD